MRSPLRIVLLAVAGLLLAPTPARAHKMEIEARTEGVTIRVVASYEGEEPAEGAAIVLRNAAGVVVASGKADAKGICMLSRPKAGSYQLAVDDGAGHHAELALPVPESDVEVNARTERRNRWLMGSIGLVAIAGGTALLRRLRRRPGGV